MVIVFIGLVLLIFITWLYPKIVRVLISRSAEAREKEARKAERQLAKQKRKEAQKAETAAPAKAEQQAMASAPLPADEQPRTDRSDHGSCACLEHRPTVSYMLHRSAQRLYGGEQPTTG